MSNQAFYFQGQEKLQRWLDRVKAQSGNHQELFSELGDILLKGVHDRFKTGTAPNGEKWKKSWRAHAQGGQTLRNNGNLLNSIHVKLSKNNVSLATNLIYAKLMQFGGTIRAKNKPFLIFKTPTGGWIRKKHVVVPARPFFGVSEDDAQNMLLAIEEYLEELLKDAK